MKPMDPNTIRACIAWLHAQAASMNDPKAKAVLNSAAFSLGVDRLASSVSEAWQSMADAPRDRPVLLLGKLCGQAVNQGHPTGLIRAVGYWDTVDEAWALTDTTWEGPFMAPVAWAELPDLPRSAQDAWYASVMKAEPQQRHMLDDSPVDTANTTRPRAAVGRP